MPKRSLLLIQFALLLPFAATPDPRAQARKPSQALRQVAEQQRKLLETTQRDAERFNDRSAAPAPGASASVFAPDPDAMDEALIKLAAERSAEFKTGDWKGEELYALAELYRLAEQFAPAGDAFRAYLKGDSKSKMAANARTGVIRTMIETEQLDEAEKWIEGGEWDVTANPAEQTARTGLYRDLALALRDRGLYDKVATLADKGYKLANSLVLSPTLPPILLETAERNQLILAAMAVASSKRVGERAGQKREAGDLNKLALDFDFNRRPELRSVYESELAIARLIGTPAPELEISRWIEGKQGGPKSLSELRGKVVLLDFWAMWSGPCIAAFPRLRGFQSKHSQSGLEIIGVTKFYGRSDTEESLSREQEFKSLQNYKAKYQLTYPFAVGKLDDVTNEERYGVAGIPTVILIDRRGVVRHVKRDVGEYRKLEKQIERLINEK